MLFIMIDFNGMSTHLGLFNAERIPLIVYLYFLVYLFQKRFFLPQSYIEYSNLTSPLA